MAAASGWAARRPWAELKKPLYQNAEGRAAEHQIEQPRTATGARTAAPRHSLLEPIVTTDSIHASALDQPDAVEDAIRDIADAVARGWIE
jgi:hypothetical protein